MTIEFRKDEEEFVETIIPWLEKQKEGLKRPVSVFLSHGRRRSKKLMREAQEQRTEQLRDVETALAILRNGSEGEVLFIRNKEGGISGFTINP